VTGFWVAALAFVLLLTGLPWTSVWGSAFGAVRTQMGWVKGAPQWNTGAPESATAHADHDHAAMHAGHESHGSLALLDTLVSRGQAERIAHPALVLAPGAVLFGPPSPSWTLTSIAQDRTQGLTLQFDASTGQELSREAFGDRHAIDRVIGYGLAWHEGALFGTANQLIGLFTALSLVTLATTGFLMWRRRRPTGALGAPPLPAGRNTPAFIIAITLLLAALLPLLAASLLLLWLIDLALPRISPAAAGWLGLRRAQ
jgi:uncharacterized iron-regulated membrane protein